MTADAVSADRLPQYQATLSRLDRFSRWTDSRFRIPFTRIHVGVEPLIGLIPGVGDAAGLVLSSYVLLEAFRVGAPGRIKRRMLFNMVVDAVGGLLPVVGDLFDIWFKANTRNTALLREWLHGQLRPPEPVSSWPFWLGWFLLLLLAVAGGYWLSSSGLVSLPG